MYDDCCYKAQDMQVVERWRRFIENQKTAKLDGAVISEPILKQRGETPVKECPLRNMVCRT